MKVYQITPGQGCCPHTEKSIKEAIEMLGMWLEESDGEDLITIKSLEMTEEEYDNLPEWNGP